MKRFYTLTEFCQDYSVGKTKAFQLIKDGKLETVKIGRRRLVSIESAEALADSLIDRRHA